VLGFYLSDHPLKGFDHLLKPFTTGKIGDAGDAQAKSKVHYIGLVSSLREIITKKGTRMAFGRLEDQSGSMELVIFPDVFAAVETLLKSEGALFVSGQLEKDDNGAKILVDAVKSVEDVYARVKKLTVSLTPDRTAGLAELKQTLVKHPGDSTVELRLMLPDIRKTVHLELKDIRGVKVSEKFFEDVFRVIEQPTCLQIQ
jgi:DNA polymerase-3 subunit alpha